MNHSDEEMERIHAELERVLGDMGASELPAVGGPMASGASDLLPLLKALPDGAGIEAVLQALNRGGRDTLFGQRGAEN